MKQEPASRMEDLVRRRLRSLRQARGWTLDQLASRAHIGASTISRIETGHRRLAIDQLADLARALETTVDDLLSTDDGAAVLLPPVRSPNPHGLVHWPLTRPIHPPGPPPPQPPPPA